MRLIDKYISKNKPLQKSKLSEVNDEILELLSKKYTVKSVHEYITGYRKISVELKYLHRYIKKLEATSSGSVNTLATPVVKASITSTPIVVKPATTTKATAPGETNKTEEKPLTILEKAALKLAAFKAAGIEPAGVTIWEPEETTTGGWKKH